MESEQKSMINGDKDYSSGGNVNTTMASSVIKHEMIDPGLESKSLMISKSENSHMPSTHNVIFTSSANNNINNNNNNNSPKMGSRRIFTPQFKLQVLESYRNDNDCKGNQRATARKYNIHRRQIQKWLQCESNLRSSVANINQSNVKHQFHNITSRQQQQQLQMPVASNNNHFSHHNHHHNHHHHPLPHQLPLDAAGQSVALNSITVPSLPTGVITSTNASTQGVLAAANLAAVVAAAAAAGAAGAMVIASTSSTNTSTTVSPLRPTAIGGRSNATMSPSLLHSHHHQQQHHHYQIPYTHTPAGSVPVSVPILTHHIPPQHLHHQHHHYQYHNLSPHAHTLTHQQPSAFMPSACLPVTVLSTAVSASTSTTTTSAPALGSVDEKGEEQNEQNISNELREATKTTTAICADVTGNRYVHSHEYLYKCIENGIENKHEGNYEGLQQYSLIRESPYSVTVTPMDLSLGSRRYNRDNVNYNLQNLSKTDDLANRSECFYQQVINDNSVVDLTFRKRKVISTTTNADEQPEKLGKFSSAENKPESDIKTEVKETDVSKENSEDDVELEVDEKSPPSKPIKLFKPYLLGDDDDDDGDKSCHGNLNATCSKVNTSEQREPIIWSNHPACVSPHSYDSHQDSSRGSNFQSPSAEKYTFPIGSPYFQGSKTSSPQSVLSPTSVPALSPSFPCPKGSPVSGYESSSSTYSDTSYRSDPCRITTNGRTYNLNLQMHTVYNDNVNQEQNCVRRWLDQDTSTNPPATNASITLYA